MAFVFIFFKASSSNRRIASELGIDAVAESEIIDPFKRGLVSDEYYFLFSCRHIGTLSKSTII